MTTQNIDGDPGVEREAPVDNEPAPRSPPKLDLAGLRLSQDFGAIAGVKKLTTSVPIKKPGRDVFVRTHPDPSYRGLFVVLQDKETGEFYLVHQHVVPHIGTDATPMLLQTTIDRHGNVFMWPLRVPGDTGRQDRWADSAMAARELAEKAWIRVKPNMGAGSYDVLQATGNIPEPEWLTDSFDKLLEVALRDRVIDSLDHPMVRKLQGAA